MQSQLKLWDFIPASDFQVPASPTNEEAWHRSRRLWRWLKQEILRRPETDASSESTQRQLPADDHFDSVALEPDWTQAAAVLAADLSECFDSSRSGHCPVRTLVGPPGSGVANALLVLTQEQKLTILSAPPSNATLDEFEPDRFNLQALDEFDDQLLVIPHLEHFFLRHEDGLNLVRSLAERLMARRRVLVGCDSWAWAFLQQAIGIEDIVGKPVTLAPFDDQRLDAWFRSSLDFDASKYRLNRSDELVFPERSRQRESDQEQPETTTLIKSLAARARGNLGVALALWRSSLLDYDPKSDESATAKRVARSNYWVLSPSELELPRVSSGNDKLHRFILHSLLLHAGLPLSTLIALLPFPREDVCCRVSELRTAGVVHEQNDALRVTLTAYPEVRRDLISEGFLADSF